MNILILDCAVAVHHKRSLIHLKLQRYAKMMLYNLLCSRSSYASIGSDTCAELASLALAFALAFL